MDKAYYFMKVPNLGKLAMEKLNRKYLILGNRRVGKTKFI
jgi:hypothetical protein